MAAENCARFAWLKTLPIFTRLHRTNLCGMQAAKEMPHATTHTHTHAWGTPHTIYLPQVASYVPNKRSCHCSSLPRPHSHLPHTPHFATVYRVQKNELSLSKSWNLIRQPTAEKRIIQFWSSRLSAGEVLRLQPNEIGWQRQMQIIASCYSRQRPVTS